MYTYVCTYIHIYIYIYIYTRVSRSASSHWPSNPGFCGQMCNLVFILGEQVTRRRRLSATCPRPCRCLILCPKTLLGRPQECFLTLSNGYPSVHQGKLHSYNCFLSFLYIFIPPSSQQSHPKSMKSVDFYSNFAHFNSSILFPNQVRSFVLLSPFPYENSWETPVGACFSALPKLFPAACRLQNVGTSQFLSAQTGFWCF